MNNFLIKGHFIRNKITEKCTHNYAFASLEMHDHSVSSLFGTVLRFKEATFWVACSASEWIENQYSSRLMGMKQKKVCRFENKFENVKGTIWPLCIVGTNWSSRKEIEANNIGGVHKKQKNVYQNITITFVSIVLLVPGKLHRIQRSKMLITRILTILFLSRYFNRKHEIVLYHFCGKDGHLGCSILMRSFCIINFIATTS